MVVEKANKIKNKKLLRKSNPRSKKMKTNLFKLKIITKMVTLLTMLEDKLLV